MTLDLNTIWFGLVGVLFMGYAILDGFDLGVGALHLFTRTDRQRRTMLQTIGPVWDGNEVWLVTAGGALFAAFPEVYATAFSGLYIPFVLLLFALIFRAVAIEFRSRQAWPAWRTAWDWSFSVASIATAVLIGVAMGNIAWGIALRTDHEFAGTFLDLLHPYTLLTGLTTLALFMMHGAIYVVLKTSGELRELARIWVKRTMIFFSLGYLLTTLATLVYIPAMTAALTSAPVLLVVPLLDVLAIANIPREVRRGRYFRAFLSSSAAMAGLLALFGIGMYPDLIRCHTVPANSLTIYNGASSPQTLSIMLIVAAIGMPLVIAYTASIYWIFRGKVEVSERGY